MLSNVRRAYSVTALTIGVEVQASKVLIQMKHVELVVLWYDDNKRNQTRLRGVKQYTIRLVLFVTFDKTYQKETINDMRNGPYIDETLLHLQQNKTFKKLNVENGYSLILSKKYAIKKPPPPQQLL